MGMWQGILQGMQLHEEAKRIARQERIEEEDRLFLRQKYNQEMLDRRRNAMLPLLIEREKTLRASATERAQLVETATGLGFSAGVANVLSKSGQLGTILDIAQRRIENDELNAGWVSNIEKSVMEALPNLTEEQLGAALTSGLSTNADLTTEAGQKESLLEALRASQSSEELDALQSRMLRELGGESTYGALPPFELELGGSKAETASDIRQLDNLIAAEIQPLFKDAFIVLPDGTFSFNPQSQDAALVRRLQTGLRQLVRERTQPGQSYDVAITDLTDFVYNATQQGLDLGEIIPRVEAQDFTIPEVTVPPKPPIETPEQFTQELGEMGVEDNFNVFNEFRGR